MNYLDSNTENRRTVRIVLTAKHTMPAVGKVSLFTSPLAKKAHPLNADGHANPEDYPEEMNTALQDMLDRDAGLTESEIYDAANDEEYYEEDEAPTSIDELFEKLAEIGESLGMNKPEEDDDDLFVFRTLGSMEKIIENGEELIEISYSEGETMDDTSTVIRYNPKKPGSVSILHSGSVMSALVCEQGVRHITAYETPIMPFEVALYTKKCEGGFTFEEGGSLDLDYMVEIRGADMQRTQMTIDAIVL